MAAIRTRAESNEHPGWLTIRNRHTGEVLRLRRVIRGGELCLELHGSVPARRPGPPLHIHYQENEEGMVVRGTLSVELDGRRMEIKAGETALLPAGLPHRWWNDGDEPLVFEGVARPLADLDQYFQEAFDVLNNGSADRPPIFYMAHLAWTHRRTQVVLFAPVWLQKVIVPAIVAVGTVLGRYRGTDWPGCSARCRAVPREADDEATTMRTAIGAA
jgi:mannose-6-phosphate isomerase-like protein (cupin superfamily)